jgi:hypothetical protein
MRCRIPIQSVQHPQALLCWKGTLFCVGGFGSVDYRFRGSEFSICWSLRDVATALLLRFHSIFDS